MKASEGMMYLGDRVVKRTGIVATAGEEASVDIRGGSSGEGEERGAGG